MSEDSTSFQTLCDDLAAIIARLESDEIPLEEAISAFERGSKIASRAQGMLQEAEQRVRMITEDATADDAAGDGDDV